MNEPTTNQPNPEARLQIIALDELITNRKHVYPVTIREIQAIGPHAVREYAARMVARALSGGNGTAVPARQMSANL